MRERRIELGDVIPAPADVWPDPSGDFTITAGTGVRAAGRATSIGEQLAGILRRATGYPIPVNDTAGSIVVELMAGATTGGGPDGVEAYEVVVTPSGITLGAEHPAGLFAAVQTVRQLFPAGGTSKRGAGRTSEGTAGGTSEGTAGGTSEGTAGGKPAGQGDVTIPGGRIADRPRFAYRGVMLDVARHFFSVDEVKAYIDAIAEFKINHLHLHLTDDQGWRIEIKSWPELTRVSGGPGTGVDGVGPGFYSQEDYAEVVAYAGARFVTIVPEIDMPGHVNAVQAAYPQLAPDGEGVPARTDRAVGYSSLVIGGELTYAFVEDVIREVAALTPGPYLHVGGDEADATPVEDYRAFVARVLTLVAKYGKRAVGWQEIAAVELPAGAVPQYWRIEPADDGVARAAAKGNRVIMSPADRTYLDMKYATDSPLGLDWAGLLGIERAYRWDPGERLPGVGEEALLGVEAALWSETLRSMTDVQMMTFPRLTAIAEIGWSPRSVRDWASFRRRLAAYGRRWTAAGIAFHRSPEIDWT